MVPYIKRAKAVPKSPRGLPLAHCEVRNQWFLLNSLFRRRSSTMNWTVMTDAWRRGAFRFSGTYKSLRNYSGNQHAVGCFRNTHPLKFVIWLMLMSCVTVCYPIVSSCSVLIPSSVVKQTDWWLGCRSTGHAHRIAPAVSSETRKQLAIPR